MYVIDENQSKVLVWKDGASVPTRNISDGLMIPKSLFIDDNGDLYVAHTGSKIGIQKWLRNSTIGQQVLTTNDACNGLFIDTKRVLYCCITENHTVLKYNLTTSKEIENQMIGTGCAGPLSTTLNSPYGIFVDSKFRLYVADTNNNRIQRFDFGKKYGYTVAGFGSSAKFTLNKPTSIILDANNYLYIVDSHNHRIVRSIDGGFQCIVGCGGTSGIESNELSYPRSIAFDKRGHLVVTDTHNYRIQLFHLNDSLCACNEEHFTDGGFENGITDWIIGGGTRSSRNWTQLNLEEFLSNRSLYSSTIATKQSIIVANGSDPHLNASIPNIVYTGNHSFRIGDTVSGGDASISFATLQLSNYCHQYIYFAWLAVLQQGGHFPDTSSFMLIQLNDKTNKTKLFEKIFFSGNISTADSPPFLLSSSYYYTPSWQVEKLTVPDSSKGHDLSISIVTADCTAGVHLAYMYIDSFSNTPI